MTKLPIVMFLFAAAMLEGGCAEPVKTGEALAPRTEPEYITGSNIARRRHANEGDGVSSMSGEAFERARSSITPPIPQTPGGGH